MRKIYLIAIGLKIFSTKHTGINFRLLALLVTLCIVTGCGPVLKSYNPSGKTKWKPKGCRAVPRDVTALDDGAYWKNLHSNVLGSDEVSIALAPMFEHEWTVEKRTFNPTGPVFDAEGNLYFSPALPQDAPILISLEPEKGKRRWVIEGRGMPVGSPMILPDPDKPGKEIVYLGMYDRALAVKTDGTILWDKDTGLQNSCCLAKDLCFGVQYHRQTDTIVGLTRDGHIYVLDRDSGEQLLKTPYSLPGEKSPRSPEVNPDLINKMSEPFMEELSGIIGRLPPDFDPELIVDILLGSNTEVANHFSIDPNTGRLWVAATAPDGEDCEVDGVSKKGALYGLDLEGEGFFLSIKEACHLSFYGGSASTPAIRPDGKRIYVADSKGNLIAVNSDNCSEIWRVDVGAQIFGSVAVASDNGEIYAAIPSGIVKVVDAQVMGYIEWRSKLDMYSSSLPWKKWENGNLNLTSIGANGVGFQGGAVQGKVFKTLFQVPLLPVTVGAGILDRKTGEVRYFTEGLDESVAVMSIGPDGTVYHGNSPVRRAARKALGWEISRGLFKDRTPRLEGGITKFSAKRLDLLIRDAACVAADRAANAYSVHTVCPDSVNADIKQIEQLIKQCQNVSAKAIENNDPIHEEWEQIDADLEKAKNNLTTGMLADAVQYLENICKRLNISILSNW